MSFEQHIFEHSRDGYTVFRAIVPPSLIRDLREAVKPLVVTARASRGEQAQRASTRDIMAAEPGSAFHNFVELPALNDAIAAVLSPSHQIGLDSVLIEPAVRAYCTHWHRDSAWLTSKPEMTPALREEWWRFAQDRMHYNQYNCALYADAATWFVPGSQLRMDDLPGEIQARDRHDALFPVGVENEVHGTELEHRSFDYCAGMPNAVQLCLQAGDFALYRPHGWHIGNYLPYTSRATLHGLPQADGESAWQNEFNQRLAAA